MNEYLLNKSVSDSKPKITLAFPISHNIMDVEKSRIMYSNLLKELQHKLVDRLPKREWEEMFTSLKEHENDSAFFQGAGRGLLLFVDADASYKYEIFHDVAPYVFVGDQFIVKDLFMLSQTVERPKYVIEIGKDRLHSWSVVDYEPVKLEGLDYSISDYFDDFDNNSTLNVGNYGGLAGKHHGHRTKDEEEEKSQYEYYKNLGEKLEKLSTEENATFVYCGVREVIDLFLEVTNTKSTIFEVVDKPFSKESKKELQTSLELVFEEKLNEDIKALHIEIEAAKQAEKLIHDIKDVQSNVESGLVKKIIFLEKNDGYSVEHNELMMQCIKANLKPIVIKSDTDDFAINAILY